MSTSPRFVCDRCGHAFDEEGGRCPKCLRKTGVRLAAVAGEPRASEASRLAAGEHSQTEGAQRASALGLAIAGGATLAIGIAFGWSWLRAMGIAVPVVSAAAIAAAGFVHAAIGKRAPDADPWTDFARRCTVAAILAIGWLFAVVLAMIMTAGLSLVVTGIVAVAVFGAGMIPVLQWMRKRDEPAPPPTGKWR